MSRLYGFVFILMTLILCIHVDASSDSVSTRAPADGPQHATLTREGQLLTASYQSRSSVADTLEATTIEPFRYADIGSEVDGILEPFRYEEGDFVPEGNVVVNISRQRYALISEKAADAVKGLDLGLAVALKQVGLLKELLGQDATTRQDLLKAETERDVTETRLNAARKDLELTTLNLEACQVKAPFPGYVAVLYKRSFEPVNRLDKIFRLVDSAKVYAVANVGYDLVGDFKRGAGATFVGPSGKRLTGTVEKVGSVIDVKSNTKKVYVLIDNPNGELEIGMTGALRPVSQAPE
jgi:RND family efflux transporter MFP subunit